MINRFQVLLSISTCATTPRLLHSHQLSPGFRQSPDANRGVAICFAVARATEGAGEVAVMAGMAAWQRVCRTMLRLHGGSVQGDII
jgi:hypothetical protein